MDSHNALENREITRVLKELRNRPQLFWERFLPRLYISAKRTAEEQEHFGWRRPG